MSSSIDDRDDVERRRWCWWSGLAAVRACAEHREVSNVCHEALIPFELLDQRSDRVGRDLRDRAADATDQMDVLGSRGRVVGRRAMAEVRVLDQAELLEQLQRAVDRGDVDG